MERDKRTRQLLRQQGWRVLRLWECEIQKDPIRVAQRIERKLRGSTKGGAANYLPSKKDLLKAADAKTAHNLRL
ncbi:MAG: DUF559 domain-containing protein [Planctomycetota bacterium]